LEIVENLKYNLLEENLEYGIIIQKVRLEEKTRPFKNYR
jgi:hypothetical protein